MAFLANDWLQRKLVNPLAFHLSAARKSGVDSDTFSVAASLKDPKHILIIPDSRSGGLFIGASQFWAIRHRYPDTKICLLVNAQKGYIAKEIPFVDHVIEYQDFLLPVSLKLRDVVKSLQDQHFDIAFCFSNEENFCPAYLCYKSGAHLRVGFQRNDFPFFNIRIVPHKEACYELGRFSLLLRTLGIPQVKERISWSVSKEGAEKLQNRFLVGKKEGEHFVGLDVGAKDGQWLTDKQIQGIAEGLVSRENTRALIFFNFEERKTANQIKETLGQKALLFQTDDLPKIVALLEACDLLVAGNTDLFHLAVAMDLPATAIFDSQDVVRWIPPSRPRINVLETNTTKSWSQQQFAEEARRIHQEIVETEDVPDSQPK